MNGVILHCIFISVLLMRRALSTEVDFNDAVNKTTFVDYNEKASIKNVTLEFEEQEYLANLSNRCMTEKDFEQLYANKSKYGLVILFARFLMNEGSRSIGLNELRHKFQLKPQRVNFFEIVEEMPENANTTYVSTTIKFFQKYVTKMYHRNSLEKTFFTPEDIEVAKLFLDKMFPEIRQLYKHWFHEKEAEKLHQTFNESWVEKEFIILKSKVGKIHEVLDKIVSQSQENITFKDGCPIAVDE